MPALIGYVATIFLANWAINTFGVVPIGFGLLAPAGVFFAGLAFTLRDLTQHELGKRAAVFAIFLGGGLSLLIDPRLGVASSIAFLASELLDFVIYSLLHDRSFPLAVAVSNLGGLLLDSALFLLLAFGSLDFLAGQVVGKLWMTLAALVVIYFVRRNHAHQFRHHGGHGDR